MPEQMRENFNYIAFGNRDYVEGEVDQIGMSRGRMFEYTPTEVAKGLEELDSTSIDTSDNYWSSARWR